MSAYNSLTRVYTNVTPQTAFTNAVTTEQTLFTFPIPGGSIGQKGQLDLELLGSFTTAAVGVIPTATFRLRFGATAVVIVQSQTLIAGLSATSPCRVLSTLRGANSEASQILKLTFIGNTKALLGQGTYETVPNQSIIAVNSAVQQTLMVTIQFSSLLALGSAQFNLMSSTLTGPV